MMNEKLKNLVFVVGSVLALSVAYAAVSYVGSYAKSIQPSSFRSFSVSGEGRVVAVPDVAQFTFSVVLEGGKDLTRLQSDNTDKANKAIAFLKSKGIDPKDIETQSYNVSPRQQYFNCAPQTANGVSRPCPPPEIVGYTITQSVKVKVRNFSTIGEVLSGIVTAGVNDVSALSFTIDDPTKVQNEARAQAIVKAKEKAQSIARAGGFRVGRLLSIQEGYTPSPYLPQYALDAAKGGVSASALPTPTVEPGSQEVNVQVNLQYEIE